MSDLALQDSVSIRGSSELTLQSHVALLRAPSSANVFKVSKSIRNV